jgi:hypothetical protein
VYNLAVYVGFAVRTAACLQFKKGYNEKRGGGR